MHHGASAWRQIAGPEGAQAVQADTIVNPAACCSDPEQVSHLERDASWEFLRLIDFGQRGNGDYAVTS
jgi:hypothetical protein